MRLPPWVHGLVAARSHNENVRVALVAESFLPHTNGVTHSLLRVIDHLAMRGHESVVIAPNSGRIPGPTHYAHATVHRTPSWGWPGYRDVRVSVASATALQRLIGDVRPDVVHLASPFMLGWSALKAARALELPTVAVYQTEVPSYASRYRAGWGEPLLWNRVRNIHSRADVTLAPSTYAMNQLGDLGVPDVRLWPRGVDLERFHPDRRDDSMRARVAPHGELLVGYVGRLAAEKRVEDLARIASMPGITLVIVGQGPSSARLRSMLPDAHFTGFLGGTELATMVASLDLFVHPGELETFCQSIQEALASGVPVIAPRRGGPIDLVQHARTGFLYNPGDLEQMETAVRTLVDDDALRTRMAIQARPSVAHRTWERVCDDLLQHYAHVMARTAPAPATDARGVPVGTVVAVA